MRHISFALTTEQVRNRIKTVTRRLGWKDARRGEWLQPVKKSQGLKKGERVEKIGAPIRVKAVRRERLDVLLADDDHACAEVVAEGFRDLSPAEFVAMFCAHNDCKPSARVTRIEFEYTEEK
jgi:hypothetical protein